MIATAKMKTARRKRIANLKKDKNCVGTHGSATVNYHIREFDPYHISIQACGLQDLLVSDAMENRNPAEHGIGQFR